jgi:alkanesulfonate monooxygenase SsuD/methylene tetrahydromethanopterin reductase-like flavin-dependent oxidoreductase (luciferase family)
VPAAELGIFVTPLAEAADDVVALARAADEAGLDYVAVQDHPYQHRFLDTWTLLSFVAARTERVRLLPDVINLPLRPPAVLAKAAASLDVLSGGRVELGLGAGAFWEGVGAMGGPVRSGPESVDALEEAIAVIRAFWGGERSATVEGRHYALRGAHPGPPPAHAIGIWIGAYGPRMLRVTGRLADGWLPSLGTRFLPIEEIPARHAAIDEAARAVGRDPREIKRACNVGLGGELLQGPVEGWADELAGLARDLRFEAFMVPAASAEDARRLGEVVAPRLRELTG